MQPPYLKFPDYDSESLEMRASRMGNLIERSMAKVGFADNFWSKCESVLELGAGQGVVALALSRLTPASCEIATVDFDVPIHENVKTQVGRRLRENLGIKITDYLQKGDRRFDLITISAVMGRDHEINNGKMLSGALSAKGVVFEFVADLPRDAMEEQFKLSEPEDGVKIWTKKNWRQRLFSG